eukprot:CAMPEP_0172331030 /NCGR_PEP_ID=MMETSP1058-20130122/61717_1 /TAXON_ID=83371 /ORGANISM="Detonula confervacea, Strain CCMP 353" /LENGTH=483 /DNA_ID=CAMNT_0013048279 /DNA_START=29 /DNA_END=1481 /DNA_ORIENTATION=+
MPIDILGASSTYRIDGRGGTKTPSSITSSSDSDQQKQQQVQREQLKFQQQQNNPKAHAFVERNTQSLTLEFNLRTVPCHISSAFPTLESVNEAVALAKRAGLKGGGIFGSGDGLIIGVGSGAAMDLAKAVADSLFGNIAPAKYGSNQENPGEGGGSLVLAPCTLGGLWAASSNSPSVLLDTKEEMLLPHLKSSWSDNLACSRRGTVVALDPSRYLAMPPLYTPFQPVKRSEYSPAPSMAHVAAAALAIVLDVARSMDESMKVGVIVANIKETEDLQTHVANELRAVASSCALVLELATQEAKHDDGGDNNAENTKLAQQHILDAIPRLSPLVEQSSLLSQMSMAITGTIPQKLANALLPSYFPQCHLVTYLACILPGLCDVISTRAYPEGEISMVEEVANSIINNGNANAKTSSLSSWASQVTMEAGIPSMASLAYGTPDLNTLVGSLDSYESLMVSLNGVADGSGRDDHWVMEDVLQRSLNR